MIQFLRSKFLFFDERKLRLLRAVDKYDEVMSFLEFVNEFCGTFIMKAGWTWTYRTWISMFIITTFLIQVAYTIVINWYDWYAVLEVLSFSGLGCQGLVKFFEGITRVDYFQKVHRDLRVMYVKYSSHPENNYDLVRCSLLTLYLCRLLAVLYLSAGLLMFVLPVYMLLVEHKQVLPFHMNVIFTHDSSTYDFVINMAYIIIIITLGVVGIVAADTAILQIVFQTSGMVDVFKNNLKELNTMLNNPDCSETEIHDKVTEVCKMHKEIIDYEENLDSAYHSTVFVQVITSVVGLSLTLFLMYMLKDWTKIMLFFATFFQLLEFCMLGTVLTIKNEEVVTAIYNVNWYLLSNSDQKRILIVLHRSQNAVEMSIGGLYMLNMETFVEIIKTIYSYFTMLISFLE